MSNTLLFILASVVLVAAFLIRFIINLQKKAEIENREAIDYWASQMVSLALSKKLNEPPEIILQQLLKDPRRELVSEIYDKVDSVTLTFSKHSDFSNIQISLEVKYNDGTQFLTNTKKNWDEIPELIRSKFIRTSSKFVNIPWEFPWTNPETA